VTHGLRYLESTVTVSPRVTKIMAKWARAAVNEKERKKLGYPLSVFNKNCTLKDRDGHAPLAVSQSSYGILTEKYKIIRREITIRNNLSQST